MKKVLFLALALCLMAGTAVAADTIKIGLMAPLTGAWASEGQDMQQIVELLADEINMAGGINGQKIEIVTEDDGGDPRTAALAAQRLSTQGLVAVVEPGGLVGLHHVTDLDELVGYVMPEPAGAVLTQDAVDVALG